MGMWRCQDLKILNSYFKLLLGDSGIEQGTQPRDASLRARYLLLRSFLGRATKRVPVLSKVHRSSVTVLFDMIEAEQNDEIW